MAIQMRRGLRADFDPRKMLPGEWAVAIDEDTRNQIVWMCFRAGVVKRMGTYEDFQEQIREATGDIRDEYVAIFNEIKDEMEGMRDTVSSDKDIVVQVKDDIITEYLPRIEALEKSAEESKAAAALSEENSAQSEANAEKWRKLSESYAHGGTGARDGEDTDNSEYWYEQSKKLAQGINGIVNMGNKTFEQLATAEKVVNYMYNVTDAFTSDETFNTPGVYYGAGNNVVWTGEGKWDVMAASAVNGIKGNNETYFHQGNYTVSPENLKLDTFAVAAQRANVAPNDTLDVAFGKLAKYCADLKNVAFSGKYADMSGIGNLTEQTTVADTDNMLVGTDVAKKITFANVFNAIKNKLTGAVSTILTSTLKGNMALVSDASGKVAAHGTVTATELGYMHGATSNIQNQIGTLSALGTTAKGNLVSAINELNTGIYSTQNALYIGQHAFFIVQNRLEDNSTVGRHRVESNYPDNIKTVLTMIAIPFAYHYEDTETTPFYDVHLSNFHFDNNNKKMFCNYESVGVNTSYGNISYQGVIFIGIGTS